MATVYVTYNCVNYADKTDELFTYDLSCTQGASLNTKSHAPDIDGWTLKSCSPTSISSVQGGETITAYYYKYADVDLNCYDENTDKKIGSDTIPDCYVGGSVTISNYAPSITDYEFDYAKPSKLTVTDGSNSAKCYYLFSGTANTYFTLSASGNTISVNITMDSRVPWIEVTYYPTNDTSAKEVIDYQEITTSTKTIQLTGLLYNTQYTVNVRYSPDGTSFGTYVGSQKITTDANTCKGTIYWLDRCDNNYELGTYPLDNVRLDITMNLASSAYAYPNTGSRYTVAKILDHNGKEYTPDSNKEVIYQPTGDFKIYFYYEDKTIASWGSSGTTYNSLSCTVALPVNFSSSNYTKIELINTSGTVVKAVTASSSSSSTVQITLKGLTGGNTYTLKCRITVPYGNQYYVNDSETIDFKLPYEFNDDDLIANCTARWYNYAAGNTGSWSSQYPTYLVQMGDYAFTSQYFKEIGVLHGGYFTQPSTTAPRSDYVVMTVTPESTGSKSVTITYNGAALSAGSTATYMLYVQTINGTYYPLPAVNPSESNSVQFLIATKPNEVSYSAGYEPVAGNEVKLKADDIKKFIHALDRTNFWFNDISSAGIDEDLIATGEPIKAVTYQDFYDKLSEFKGIKNFLLNFTRVDAGSPIYAANLVFLKTSINNMLGVL